MQRFLQPFHQLRWKLTFSYALTNVAAFLLVVMLLVGGWLLWLGTHTSTFILNNLSQEAPQGIPYLQTAERDPEPLATWLQILTITNVPGGGPFRIHPIFLTAVNSQGKILASIGSQPLVVGLSVFPQLPPASRANLTAVLTDPQAKAGLATQETNNTLVAIVPMTNNDGQVQGALLLKADQPQTQILFSYFFDIIFFGGFGAFILTIFIGTIFGYLIARGLTRRLNRLSVAANRWSRGDFSASALDTSQDELGQVVRQFNYMAEQLQNLLETRQQLATLEERNRLARDLHDSVKQQVFAISMQIAATRILLKRDIGAAEERLNKAEKLVKQAQQELTSLIRELRPVALEGKGLVAALHELAPQWSYENDIVANLRVEGSQKLPQTVEEALFRVAQEALSNIARHSKATLVQITLHMSGERVTLTIQDNGQGFDLSHLERRGVGLYSMQERMKALGGDLKLESSPGEGTLVMAHCTRLGTDMSETTREQKAATLQEGKVM